MKYLKHELYMFSEESKWHKACVRYEKEFCRIKHKFPKAFVAEMLENHAFHDSCVHRLALDMVRPGEEVLCIEMSDGYDSGIRHTLILRGVSTLKMNNMLWESWLYTEVLPQKKGRLSLEVAFSGMETFGSLYVEFDKLEYSYETPSL